MKLHCPASDRDINITQITNGAMIGLPSILSGLFTCRGSCHCQDPQVVVVLPFFKIWQMPTFGLYSRGKHTESTRTQNIENEVDEKMRERGKGRKARDDGPANC
jgi:hypothetical protein